MYEVEEISFERESLVVPPGMSPLKYLAEWHKKCKEAGGKPYYKTRFVTPLPEGVVIAVCYGAGKQVKGGKIIGIPKDLWRKIHQAPVGEKAKVVEEYLKAKGLL